MYYIYGEDCEHITQRAHSEIEFPVHPIFFFISLYVYVCQQWDCPIHQQGGLALGGTKHRFIGRKLIE